MSFLAQNWPILLFAGVMIYMHFFMHRGHGRHRHRDHAAEPGVGQGRRRSRESGSRATQARSPSARRMLTSVGGVAAGRGATATSA